MADGKTTHACVVHDVQLHALESTNAQPEMTAKIVRAKPLVRLSYSLNPLGVQFPSAGSMCR